MSQSYYCRKMGADVPDIFRFTFKFLKDITHAKQLLYNPDDVIKFTDIVSRVGVKKGYLLVQFPPGLNIDCRRQLENLLIDLNHATGDQWRIAIEFRNRSWYVNDIYDLLNEYNTGLVLHDMPLSATPMIEQKTGFIYLRFHGPNGAYRESYSEDFLSEYSYYIKEWINEGKTVYTYFNNTMGDALNNLISLNNHFRL